MQDAVKCGAQVDMHKCAQAMTVTPDKPNPSLLDSCAPKIEGKGRKSFSCGKFGFLAITLGE